MCSVIEDCPLPRRFRAQKNKCISMDAIMRYFHYFATKQHTRSFLGIFPRDWNSMNCTLEITCIRAMFVYKRGRHFKVGCGCCCNDATSLEFSSLSEVFEIMPSLAIIHRLVEPYLAYLRDVGDLDNTNDSFR